MCTLMLSDCPEDLEDGVKKFAHKTRHAVWHDEKRIVILFEIR